MFAILRGANGRRHEVDFNDDPVFIGVSMSAATLQITMTAVDPGDPAKGRFITVALPRDALAAAMAAAAAVPSPTANPDCASSAMNEFWSLIACRFEDQMTGYETPIPSFSGANFGRSIRRPPSDG